MVERNPVLTFIAHAVMILGVLVVAFPLYLAFVASTHTAQEIVQAPMPLLSPTSFFLLVINMVYAFFDTFAIVDATTHGGPGQATSILVYKVYYDGFKAMDMGGSAAQSVVLMTIVIALTVVQFRFIEKKVNY